MMFFKPFKSLVRSVRAAFNFIRQYDIKLYPLPHLTELSLRNSRCGHISSCLLIVFD